MQLDSDRSKSIQFVTASYDGTSRTYSLTHDTDNDIKHYRSRAANGLRINLDAVFKHEESSVYC